MTSFSETSNFKPHLNFVKPYSLKQKLAYGKNLFKIDESF